MSASLLDFQMSKIFSPVCSLMRLPMSMSKILMNISQVALIAVLAAEIAV